MNRIFALLLLTVSGIHIISAQSAKTITHEAMWAMKRVGSPEISPDGKMVVYQVTEPSYDDKEIVNDLWIAPTDGSAQPRRLTGGKGGESGYKWSPDGKHLAFVAKRDGDEAAQIYLLNVKDGGEAQRFTNLSTGASAPQWSTDGKSILFTSSVWPGAFTDSLSKKAEEDRKKIKYKARVYTSFPIRQWDHWLDEKQTHVYVQSLSEGSKPQNLLQQTSLSQKPGFSLAAAAFAPDGKSIIASLSTDANTGAWQDPTFNLYAIQVAGGDARQLTSDGNNYGMPVFSPDGKYLLCMSGATNNYKVYNEDKLIRFDWPSMQNKTPVTPGLDRPVNSFKLWQNTVFMCVEDQGRDKLMQVPIAGGKPVPLGNSLKGCYNNVSVSGGASQPVLVASYETASAPPEVVSLQPGNQTHTMISNANTTALASIDMPYPEEFWTTSSRGKKIRSLVVKPAGFDAGKKYPLFVVMHGGPAGAWKESWSYRWNYHLLAAPGYVLVVTDYTGSTGYGEKFGQDIHYDPFKGPANEINEAAADAIKRYSFIDGSRQACGGASYGGHLASWMQATTTHYKCLINHAGLVNAESQWGTSDYMWGREVMNGGPPWTNAKTWQEQNPIKMATSMKTPMLLTVGELDYRVPLNNTLENWGVQQRLKIPSKLIVFPEENHWILKAENSRFFYKSVHEWLELYLK